MAVAVLLAIDDTALGLAQVDALQVVASPRYIAGALRLQYSSCLVPMEAFPCCKDAGLLELAFPCCRDAELPVLAFACCIKLVALLLELVIAGKSVVARCER
jgi:hypothetical protein